MRNANHGKRAAIAAASLVCAAGLGWTLMPAAILAAGAPATAETAAPAPAAAQAEGTAADQAQRILAASDAVRNPTHAFALTTTLTEYHNGQQTDTNTLEVYAKADSASGQFRNLIRFAAPARDLNKLMLKNGNDLWFYDPASQASVRISPRQRLLGQAANGDVVTVNLAKDYRAELLGEEEVQDGDRVLRPCHHLALSAVAADVTYSRIEMWIERDNDHPIKSKFYAESGQLLKTAYYRHYERELEGMRPTETVIIDGLDRQWVTIMQYANYAWRDVPDSWLQREYLPRFKPE